MNFLLLRGLSREQRHWGTFPGLLRATVPESNVFCLDLPGTGTEHIRSTPAGVPAIVADLRRRWLPLREEHAGPWCLLGMSLGGMVAMEWCSEHPRDFARLILCNTSAANLSPPWSRLSIGIVPQVLRALVTGDRVERERIVLSITTRRRTDLPTIAREWAVYQEDRPVSRLTVLRQLWAASRYRAPEQITVPALLLAGGRDPLVDPSCQQQLATHFRIPLTRHPEAGHELALDAPDWVVEHVSAWLSQNPSASMESQP